MTCRVLHVGKYYPPHKGGMEVYLQQLVSHQSRTMDVTALVANDFRHTLVEPMDGARIVRAASLGVVASMPVTPTMAWHIHQAKPDVIHLHTPNPGAALALLISQRPAKLIITHHADTLGRKHLRQLTDPIVRRVMERAAAIIVTSKRYLESSEELAPFQHKCCIIPLGIDASGLAATDGAVSQQIRAYYGDRLILAVGRLVPYKGFDYLIQSMKNVRATLLLIGTGPMQAEIQACIKKSCVQDKVHMLGHVDDLVPYYKAANMLVMPSITRAEAFGVVQMEAMAAGIPVINTDIPSGVPEVSINGRTGLTVPPNNPQALADAINLLLDDTALRQHFGNAARERVCNQFSVVSMASRTMELYAIA